MINSRAVKIIIISGLILTAAYLVNRTWEFSKVYPFSHITIDSTLGHSVRLFNKESLFGSKILSINYQPLYEESAIHYFNSIDRIYSVTVMHEDRAKNITISGDYFNTDFFVFCFFLIVIGCIHFIWGLMVYFIRKIYSSARYYSRFSINFGLIYLGIVYFLVSDNYIIITIIAGSFFYQLVKMLLEIGHLSQRRLLGRLILFSFVCITAILVYIPISINFTTAVTAYLTVIITSTTAFSIFIIKRNLGNRFRNQTTYLILSAGIIGILTPLFTIGIMIHFDFPVPFSIISLLTIITPVIIGRNFIEQSQINDLISRKIHSLQFSIDFITGVVISFTLTILFRIPHQDTVIYISSVTGTAFAILFIRHLLLLKLRKQISGRKDLYTEALQVITETSVAAEAFEARFERIEIELYAVLETSFIKIGIFPDRMEGSNDIFHDDIIRIPSTSPLASYYVNRDDIIKRDLLFNRSIDEALSTIDTSESVYIIVPAILHNKIIGVLMVGERRRHVPYFKDDVSFLSAAGTLIFQMIENETLFKQSIIRGKYEQELDNASYIQMRLFPAHVPYDRGFETSIYYRPYNKVTGDIIDIIPLDENRTAIFIGDITGHGLPAAMVHSTTLALITSLLTNGKDLQEVLMSINSFLVSRYRGHELITMFGCIYSKNSRKLEYINAGHPMPYLIYQDERKIDLIESKGHILGVMDNPFYCTSTVSLKKGMQLLFYTDGIVEIQKNQSDSNIGSAFIEDTLIAMSNTTIEEKTEQIVSYIEDTELKNISDDITFAFIEIE